MLELKDFEQDEDMKIGKAQRTFGEKYPILGFDASAKNEAI